MVDSSGVALPRRRVRRVFSGMVVVALAGGGVGLATVLPTTGTVADTITQIDVPAATTTLVCPGPLTLPDATTSGDSAFNRVPVAPVTEVDAVDTSGLSGSTLSVLGGDTSTVLTGTGTVRSPSAAVLFTAEPRDGVVARIAGVTSALVTDGDLRGLSTGVCARPTPEVWLVGGSTDLSSTAELVLVNPGATTADVTLTLWGPNGVVDLANSTDVLVAPGESKTVILPAVAAQERRIVVRVQASGGQVSAYLQDSLLDGFTPRGTDVVTGGAAAATRQVIPGVALTDAAVDDDDAAQIRLLIPGEEDGSVSVALIGPDGEVALPGAQELALTAGTVTDISLGGLPAGAYTAVVESDRPVVAGVLLAREGESGELDQGARLDRTWIPATATGSAVAAVPSGADTVRVLLSVLTAQAEATSGLSATAEPSPTPTQGERPAAQPDTATPTGHTVDVTIRAYGSGGVLVEKTVAVPVTGTLSVPMADLASNVTGIEVVAPDGAEVSWALLATASVEDGTLISVVTPLVDQASDSVVRVREATRVGLD